MASTTNQLIIELILRDQASGAAQNLNSTLKSVDTTAKQVNADLKDVGAGGAAGIQKANVQVDAFRTKIDGIGRRDVSRAMTGAFMGVDAALTSIGDKADGDTKKFLDMAQSAEKVAVAFAFGGAIGGGLALLGVAIGLVVGYLKEQHDALVQVISVSDDYINKTRGMTAADEALGKANVKWIDDELSKLAELIAKRQEAANSSLRAAGPAGAVGMAFQQSQIDKQIAQTKAGIDALKSSIDSGYEGLEHARAGMGDLGIASEHAASSISQLTSAEYLMIGGVQQATDAISTQTRIIGGNIEQLDARHRALLNDKEDTSSLAASLANVAFDQKQAADATAIATKALSDEAAAAQKVHDAIAGMITKAITPTFPTAEEMKTAKAGGQTPQHWDELARQAEDVALRPGTLSKYTQLQGALKETGMSAEAFAKGFRDMSLFADPANLKFADMGPIVANVKQQIQSLVGQANLASAAFQEVWKSLTPTEKVDLNKALGLQPGAGEGDAYKAFTGGKTDDALKKAQDMNAAITGIPTSITTTFNLAKAGDWDTTLQSIIDDVYKIPAAANVTATIVYNSSGTETTGAAAPPGPTPLGGMQAGGYGVATGYQWFRADPGEGYWFSGKNWDAPLPGPEQLHGKGAPPGYPPAFCAIGKNSHLNWRMKCGRLAVGLILLRSCRIHPRSKRTNTIRCCQVVVEAVGEVGDRAAVAEHPTLTTPQLTFGVWQTSS